MNPFIWCAVGVLLGLVASKTMPVPGVVGAIETVLVAVFGAFIGGEFVASAFADPALPGGFRASSLGFSMLGGVVMLVLLRVMRKAVGPMRPHKLPRKTRP
jgi:uncharacterized membrane protein YeaQ/YmgE (transglycosylase-associated protein family)